MHVYNCMSDCMSVEPMSVSQHNMSPGLPPARVPAYLPI